MPQRNFLTLLVMVAASFVCYVRGGQNPYARYVAGGFAAIDRGAIEEVPDRDLFNAAMQGMVDVLHRHGDAHSEFLPEEEAEPLRAQLHQQFGGIGVRIQFAGKPPRLVIVGPPDAGSPAARANLLPGDHITAIDGRPTSGMTMGDVLRSMRGDPGTKVTLTVEQAHESEPRTVELTRAVINVESIVGDVRGNDGKWQFALSEDPRIALVRITSFGDRTAEELERVLTELTAAGVKAVVLDLRDNAGGVLDAATAVCSLWLPGGKQVVELRSRERPTDRRITAEGGTKFLELPLAVLINQNSASAAEIVAACLQDHGRAVGIGQRTYGKGTVQHMIEMESGKSLLKLTTNSFWRPSGTNIHRASDVSDSETWGVLPDVGYEVKWSPDEYAVYRKYRAERDVAVQAAGIDLAELGEPDDPPVPEDYVDAQLAKAVEYLQGKLDASPAVTLPSAA